MARWQRNLKIGTMRMDRTNTGRVGQWWWTIDRVLLLCFVSLMLISAVMVTAASPPVARRVGFEAYHFVTRQYVFLVLSFFVMLGVSMLDVRTIRRFATIGLIGSIAVMLLLPLIGSDNKGATRWLDLGFFTLQPSEFLKPCFSIAVAWIFSEQQKMVGFPGYKIASSLFVLCALLLLIQPDVGMTMILTAIFGVQLFLSGISILWVGALAAVGMVTLFAAYTLFPHVADRINGFLDPSTTDNYQVNKSLEAFSNGGLTGTGPGEGQVKWQLPDAHTDFIYAVVGEEFGMVIALLTAGLFVLVVMRGLQRASQATDMFIMLALAGLVAQFGLQAFVNMGVAVHLLPAKGMTLPFLSYGGSSLLAMAVTAGAILGLSRRRYGSLHRVPHFKRGNA
jgi:cell division protein FtsW